MWRADQYLYEYPRLAYQLDHTVYLGLENEQLIQARVVGKHTAIGRRGQIGDSRVCGCVVRKVSDEDMRSRILTG